MKKVILSVAVIAIATLSASAQKKSADKDLKFSVGAEIALPIGDFNKVSSIGFGGTVQGEYAAAETVGITLNAGFMTFSGKTVSGIKFPTTSIIPVLAGAKFYFAEKFYGHAQLGMSFISLKQGGVSASTSAFTYAPGIGYQASENFDVSVRYQSYSKGGTSSFIGLRAAYNF
jgi:hypothetical protein